MREPLSHEQLQQYLKKIGFKGAVTVNVPTLNAIVEGHCFTFPFETLFCHRADYDGCPSKRSQLTTDWLFDKMVMQGFGGRCIELNVLLQTVLRKIGFDVMPLDAEYLRHCEDKPREQRPRHSAAIVTLENQQFLVDAGTGAIGLLAPAPLILDSPVTQYSEAFRLMTTPELTYVLQIRRDGQWTALYGFNMQPAEDTSYEKTNNTNKDPKQPGAFYSTMLVCTRPVRDGHASNTRYLMLNDKFYHLKAGELTEIQTAQSQQQLHQIFSEQFHMTLPSCPIRFTEEQMQAYLNGQTPIFI
tara:strand:- start:22316 stop:23215 length:900 start_codon:yes stop_codon:yes gene_type:complete